MARQNEFIQMPDTNLYVYSHAEYTQAFDVKFTNISRALQKPVVETYELVLECGGNGTEHDDDDLLTFVVSNPELIVYYQNREELKGKQALESLKFVEKNKKYRNIEDEKFYCDHNTYDYGEDAWNRRLYVATKLRYRDFDVNYTASIRGISCNYA